MGGDGKESATALCSREDNKRYPPETPNQWILNWIAANGGTI